MGSKRIIFDKIDFQSLCWKKLCIMFDVPFTSESINVIYQSIDFKTKD